MSNTSRKRAIVAEEIISWLDGHYELQDGVCLPRSLLYQHYLDSCLSGSNNNSRTSSSHPIGAAAFGKMVRRRFNEITTRRLGTRGQSKYHYYGLGIKKSSKYYSSGQGLFPNHQPLSTSLPSFEVFKSTVTPDMISTPTTKVPKNETSIEQPTYLASSIMDMSSDPSTSSLPSMVTPRPVDGKEVKLESAMHVLRSFPSSFDLFVPPGIAYDKLDTFLIMYKTHCHRLIDAIVCSDFQDVQVYINHFWTEIPDHLKDILSTDFLSRVVESCDSLFYESLELVILPSNYEDISDHVLSTMETIHENLPLWVNFAIRSLPKSLAAAKVKVLNDFLRTIRRHISLIPLIRSCHLILSQPTTVKKMVHDLKKVDFTGMTEDVQLIEGDNLSEIKSLLSVFFRDDGQSVTINGLARHVKETVGRIVRSTTEATSSSTTRGCHLLLAFGRSFNSLSRELTLTNAISFGYWHLVFLTMNDLALVYLEDALKRESVNHGRTSLSRRYFQPESSTSAAEKEFILQLL